MSIINLINLINNLITNKIQQKSFSSQKGGQSCQNLTSFKRCLKIFSGNDEVGLLKKFINTINGKKLIKSLNLFNDLKFKNSIKNLSNFYNKLTNKNLKKEFLNCLTPNLTFNILKNFNYKLSSKNIF